MDGLLGNDPRLARTASGWTIRRSSECRWSTAEDLVAVAIAATGADPQRHRLVRLAGSRVRSGTISARFDLLLNPERAIPGYVAAAARILPEAVDEAPTLAQAEAPLREFLGESTIVAYGVAWIREFLAVELQRIGVENLTNRWLELDDLAPVLQPVTRKPSLRSLARHLGVTHSRPNHPPSDADAAARVACKLLTPTDNESPVLVGGGALSLMERAGSESRSRALRDRSWLADVPAIPGVYTVLDQADVPLYVGKAVDLRRRLGEYLSRSFPLNRHLEGLGVRAASVAVEVCPSDLEARLLEARLIRQHQPPFNVQRQSRPRATYLRGAPQAAVPRLQLARQVVADGAVYVGPFPSERAARAALVLVRAIYPQACARRLNDRVAQRRAVDAALQLLGGQKTAAIATLRARMRASAAQEDHLGVDRQGRLLRTLLAFEVRPSPLLGLPSDGELLAIDRPLADGNRRAHLIRAGHLLASTSIAPSFDWSDTRRMLAIAAELLEAATAVPDGNVDAHAPVVLQWLSEPRADRLLIPVARLRRDTEYSTTSTG